MIIPYVLAMVIVVTGGPERPTTIVHEYNSKEACEAAKDTNRAALSGGKVVLATCTRK